MSAKDYEPGDIIEDWRQPFCKTVSIPSQKGKICDGCFKCAEPDLPLNLGRCTGCTHMFYCSPNCQLDDWNNGHKIECRSKAFLKSFDEMYSRTGESRVQLLRGLALLRMNPEMANNAYPAYDGTTICFNDLLPQLGALDITPFYNVCLQLAKELSEECFGDNQVGAIKRNLLRLTGVLQSNGFAIYNLEETVQLGNGIYIEKSIFNHSCKPNAMFCQKGTRIEVRALAPIKKGQKAFISYMNNEHIGRTERKDFLMSRYNLDCHCQRCESDDDDKVDFDKLNRLVLFFNSCEFDESLAASCTVIMFLIKQNEVIQMMKKIYNEYDCRVSTQYARAVYSIINTGKFRVYERAQVIRELVHKARVHLRISYGRDHIDCLKLERALAVVCGK